MMRRALACFLFALPVLALSNKVTLKDDSGSSHGTRQFVIPRYFAQDDVCANPRPYIGGSPVAMWQTHVDNRWPATTICPGGSAKFAIIVIETTLGAGASVDVEFRSSADSCHLGSSAACAAAAMTRQQMLDFDTGSGTASWGAKLSLTTGGLTQIVSARSMVSSNHYQVIHDGPIFTEVLVREGPDSVSGATSRNTSLGFHCTGYGSSMSITDALNSTQATLTVPGHGIVYGSIVEISGLTGNWAALNGIRKVMSIASADSFSVNVNSTALGSYSGQAGAVRCSCPAPYAGMTWSDDSAYHSIRPSFWLRFYRRWQKVEVDFVAVNGWMDRFVDQRIESYTLYSGGAESTVVMSQANAFLFPIRSMWWEPTFWNGATPLSSHIDFNLAYLTHSRLVPGLDPTKTPSATGKVATDYASFLASDQGATTSAAIAPRMGQATLPNTLSAGGANTFSSLFSRHTVLYFTSFDPRAMAAMLGIVRAMMHMPMHYLEASTSGSYLLSQTVNPFGRTLSVERRPYFTVQSGEATRTDNPTTPLGSDLLNCVTRDCMIAGPVSNFYAIQSAAETVNRFTYDNAHLAEEYFIPYMLTGKRLFAEALYGQAGAALGTGQASATYASTRWYSKGLIMTISAGSRGWAWPLKSLGRAAAAAPDGSPEQTYFTRLLNNNTEMHEGRWGITDGAFPPASATAPYGCPSTAQSAYAGKPITYSSVWCLGRYFMQFGEANPLNFISEETISDGGFDRRVTSMGVSAWMYSYAALVLAHLRDLGFVQVVKSQEATMRWFVGFLYDTGYGQSLFPHTYRMPALQYVEPGAATHKFLADWSSVYAGLFRTFRLSRALSPTDLVVRTATVKLASTPFVPVAEAHGSSFKVDDEIVLRKAVSGTQVNYSGPLSAATGRAVFTRAHDLQSGDLVMIAASTPSGSITNLPIEADTSNCVWPGGKSLCYAFVKVIDSNSVEFYSDGALTTALAFSADVPTFWAGYNQLDLENSTIRCGGGHCRGFNHTTAAAHAAGSELKWTGAYTAPFMIDDEDFAYAHYYRAVLSYGVTYPIRYTDSVTGRPVTTTRAYEHVAGYVSWQNKYAENPRWAFVPWWGPRNLRVNLSGSTADLFYVAPDGNACKYALSTSPFASSDDSGDSSDGDGVLSRHASLGSLASGTHYLRVTCGPGGGAGRYYGTFQVP